jgi:HTH-type transcriptional regulator, competence development regulator
MTDFGTRLKNLRKERRITQRDLATKVDVDFTYISKMESGKLDNFPSIDIIKKIAGILETDPDELIFLAKKIPENIRETIANDDLAATFLRKVPHLTTEQRKLIKDVIDKG